MLVDLSNNDAMAPPQSTSRVVFSQLAWACFRLLGAVALLTAAWEFVPLASGFVTHLSSGAAWLTVFFAVPLIVLWGVSGFNLLRGRTSGCFTLCVLTCFSILSCGVQPASFLHPWLCLWLGPLPFAADVFLTEPLALLYLVLLLVTRVGVYFAGPPGPPLSIWTLLRRVALVPALTLLFVGWWRAQESLELAAWDLIYNAWSASRENKDVTANAILGRVIDEGPFTTAWCEARFTDAQ